MTSDATGRPEDTVTLFLCGDVMTGRGIDQALPHPGDPRLYESFVRDAGDYLALAESVNGPVARPLPYDAVWGEALAELRARCPDARIINLETSVTDRGRPEPKGINYRMHPGNVPCLTAPGVDCCVLANNHVLDWGRDGLADTLVHLSAADIAHTGAGPDGDAAFAPAALPVSPRGRVLVHAAATGDSGVPGDWAAGAGRAGVHRLPDLSETTLTRLADAVQAARRAGDVVVMSLHWGGNWGFGIPEAQRRFARGLVDSGAVDVVHGHSAHHVKGFELYRGRLILYGCGDFLNDYEGIGGHERFRGDLGLMYFPTLDAVSGELRELALVPTRVRRFRIERARGGDRDWLARTLARECRRFGTVPACPERGAFTLRS